MRELTEHYQLLLGLDPSWEVSDVSFSAKNHCVEIQILHIGKYICPKCGALSQIHDYGKPRRWRHRDTMQYETILVASVPRCYCSECGPQTLPVPWGDRYSHFTQIFEDYAVEVLRECGNTQAACRLLKINWVKLNKIMKRAVELGLERRGSTLYKFLGIDEKSFLKGQNYVTVLNDIESGTVIDIVEGRDSVPVKELLQKIGKESIKGVKAVAMDFWQAFISMVKEVLPDAEIVHDKFHISGYLGKSVDTVRKQEHKALMHENDETLKKTKFLWLTNPENMKAIQRDAFDDLLTVELKTGKAWAFKNTFRKFWDCEDRITAKRFFEHWYEEVIDSGLKPLIAVGEMLERHLERVLNYFTHRISNGVSEGLNSKIQAIKTAARGFHSFESYRIRILFFCGGLDLSPRCQSPKL
jgi:transposase